MHGNPSLDPVNHLTNFICEILLHWNAICNNHKLSRLLNVHSQARSPSTTGTKMLVNIFTTQREKSTRDKDEQTQDKLM